MRISATTLFRSCSNQSVPAKLPFQPMEKAVRHPAKVPLFLVLIRYVFLNPVREDVVLADLEDSVVLHQPSDVSGRVAECNWAAGLRFRVTSDQFGRAPECSFPILEDDPEGFPAPPRIEHEPNLGFRLAILLDFLKDSFRVRGMVHDAKR